MRYVGGPEPQPPSMVAPASDNKVMQLSLQIGDATLTGADNCTCVKPSF